MRKIYADFFKGLKSHSVCFYARFHKTYHANVQFVFTEVISFYSSLHNLPVPLCFVFF